MRHLQTAERTNGAPVIDAYEPISPLDTPDWDTVIRRYDTKYLFHETCWLRFLQRSQGATVHGIKLLDPDGAVVGYFCGATVRKGLFRLLGSPLQGWTTNFMGPLVNEVHTESLLRALDQFCRSLGANYIELSNPALPADTMRAAGYELDPDMTFLVTIDSEAAMWGRLKSECRNRVRRGLKNGLQVERATDPAFVRQYYDQLKEVFLRQGLVPTYGEDRVQTLWDTLMPAGKLLALRVRRGDETVATGLFPHDERAIYFWGGASWPSAYSLYPNELLHWNAMLFALERGVPTYNMCGGGSFKPKFGGAQIVTERWFKALTPAARIGRRAFKHYVAVRQKLLGRLTRTLKGRPAPATTTT
jgi:hypothetical protein